LWGVPLGWRTRISVWEPTSRFVDEQEAGPYAYWHHLHEFEPEGDGTRMRDQVTYRLPMGPLGELAHALWVQRQLRTIFDYREGAITRWASASTPAKPA
jgi:ligand-binding SRPBCC domain-containing protein